MSEVVQSRPQGLKTAKESSTSSFPSSNTSGPPVKRQKSVHYSADSLIRTASTPSSMRPRNRASEDEITPIATPGAHPDYQSTSDRRDLAEASSDGSQSIRRRTDVTQIRRDATNSSRSQSAHSQADEEDGGHTSWYKRVAEKYGSIELENKGSVARDHLALERTFLAWLRTSLAFASIGIAITQLFRLNTTIAKRAEQATTLGIYDQDYLSPMDASAATRLRHVGKPLGATFLGIAILVLFVGFHRYFESQHWIIRGKFPASRGSVALIALVSGALIIGSLVVVIAIAPMSWET